MNWRLLLPLLPTDSLIHILDDQTADPSKCQGDCLIVLNLADDTSQFKAEVITANKAISVAFICEDCTVVYLKCTSRYVVRLFLPVAGATEAF